MPTPVGPRYWKAGRCSSMSTPIGCLQPGWRSGCAAVQIPEQRVPNRTIAIHHTRCGRSGYNTRHGQFLSKHNGLHRWRYRIRNRCLRYAAKSIVASPKQVLLSESTFRHIYNSGRLLRPDGRRFRTGRFAQNRSAIRFIRWGLWLSFSQTFYSNSYTSFCWYFILYACFFTLAIKTS